MLRYAGAGTNVIELPTCQNGIKDGSEADVDCGGLCKQKCGPQKKCAKNGDCFNNVCIKNKCGGLAGTSQGEAGESCKQIIRDYPKARNGRYWIRGVGNTVSAFKVYCWMADRLGGGWTLGFTNAYGWCHVNSGDQGSVDSNVLGPRTGPCTSGNPQTKQIQRQAWEVRWSRSPICTYVQMGERVTQTKSNRPPRVLINRRTARDRFRLLQNVRRPHPCGHRPEDRASEQV